ITDTTQQREGDESFTQASTTDQTSHGENPGLAPGADPSATQDDRTGSTASKQGSDVFTVQQSIHDAGGTARVTAIDLTQSGHDAFQIAGQGTTGTTANSTLGAVGARESGTSRFTLSRQGSETFDVHALSSDSSDSSGSPGFANVTVSQSGSENT